MRALKEISELDDSRSMIAFSLGFLGVMERFLRKEDIGFIGSHRSIGNMDGWERVDAPTVGSDGSGDVCGLDCNFPNHLEEGN